MHQCYSFYATQVHAVPPGRSSLQKSPCRVLFGNGSNGTQGWTPGRRTSWTQGRSSLRNSVPSGGLTPPSLLATFYVYQVQPMIDTRGKRKSTVKLGS